MTKLLSLWAKRPRIRIDDFALLLIQIVVGIFGFVGVMTSLTYWLGAPNAVICLIVFLILIALFGKPK